jgi:hypothetical protein
MVRVLACVLAAASHWWAQAWWFAFVCIVVCDFALCIFFHVGLAQSMFHDQ